LWADVIAFRAPQVAEDLSKGDAFTIPRDNGAIPYLQAFNIWFHLARIIEENVAVRRRRITETDLGPSAVSGSFAKSRAALKDKGISEADLSKIGRGLVVGPTLTAHPTEAKRVTVLEIHRRIYRTLVALETQRWTPREREKLRDDLRGEIDLLWMTGELRLERPSLSDEIEWGLQFFRDSIYEAVPQVFERYLAAGFAPDPAPGIRFHSWIGGDRDGNPNVTARVTEEALLRNKNTILEQYLTGLREAAARISISSSIVMIPDHYRISLDALVAEMPEKLGENPGEIFRQAITVIRSRIEQLREGEGGYRFVNDFIDDLKVVEEGLESIGAQNLAHRYIRPIRWQAQTFGFRTATLDVRQNSTVTTDVLSEIWSLQGDGSDLTYGTDGWSQHLRAKLSSQELTEIDVDTLSDQGKEVFLLARYAGFDAETLDLRVVPLFETIDDLRVAPSVLTGLLNVPLIRRCYSGISCGLWMSMICDRCFSTGVAVRLAEAVRPQNGRLPHNRPIP